MANINDVADYIITRLVDAGACLNQLKLQKLLYYVQAWHLAYNRQPMFEGRFQAWVHGPVNRGIFDRFRNTKMLYSNMARSDIRPEFNSEIGLGPAERANIDAVLEVYGPLTGDQLEAMTHQEEPWLLTRSGLQPDERCEKEIDEAGMGSFYRARLGK